MHWRHIYPLNDEHDHDTSVETGRECHCGPEIDWDDRLVIHRSFDGREIVEQADELWRKITENERTAHPQIRRNLNQ